MPDNTDYIQPVYNLDLIGPTGFVELIGSIGTNQSDGNDGE